MFLTFKPFRYTSTLDHEVYVQESRIELEPSRSTLNVGAYRSMASTIVVVERVTVSVAVAAFPAASSAVTVITFVPD